MASTVPQPSPAPAVDLRLYAVLDPARCRGRDAVPLAAAAARGGATLLQLRDKASDRGALLRLAGDLMEALAPAGIPLVINDHVDVALLSGAAGVHLGRNDRHAADARAELGDRAIVGVTVHHDDEAAAVQAGVSTYAGIGPVFQTGSKQPEDLPIGPEGFARLALRIRARLPAFPCCGIAGIDHVNAASVIAAGADGVAVIADIFMADDVEAATRRLRATVDRALRQGQTA